MNGKEVKARNRKRLLKATAQDMKEVCIALYRKEYCNLLLGYFDVPPMEYVTQCEYDKNGNLKAEKPVGTPCTYPTKEGFASSIGVSCATLDIWAEEFFSFKTALKLATECQYAILMANSLGGEYNSAIAKAELTRRFGYNEETQESEEVRLKVSVIGDGED